MSSPPRLALIASALALPALAEAAPRPGPTIERVFVGTRTHGTNDSSIGDATYMSTSPIAVQIYRNGAGCDIGDLCVLRALVSPSKQYWVLKVLSAKKLPDDRRPEDMIRFIYASWSPSGFTLDDDDLGKVYSPRLAKLIVAERARGRKEEDEILDQPFYNGHDGNPVKLKADVTMTGDDSAIVRTVHFVDVDAADRPHKVNFEMVRIDGRWRIDDARLTLADETKLSSFAEFLAPRPASQKAPAAPTETKPGGQK